MDFTSILLPRPVIRRSTPDNESETFEDRVQKMTFKEISRHEKHTPAQWAELYPPLEQKDPELFRQLENGRRAAIASAVQQIDYRGSKIAVTVSPVSKQGDLGSTWFLIGIDCSKEEQSQLSQEELEAKEIWIGGQFMPAIETNKNKSNPSSKRPMVRALLRLSRSLGRYIKLEDFLEKPDVGDRLTGVYKDLWDSSGAQNRGATEKRHLIEVAGIIQTAYLDIQQDPMTWISFVKLLTGEKSEKPGVSERDIRILCVKIKDAVEAQDVVWVKQPGKHTKTRPGSKKRKATSALKDNDNDETGGSRKKSKQTKNQAADPASQSQASPMKQERHVLKGKSSGPSQDPDEGEKRELGEQHGLEQQDDPKKQDVLEKPRQQDARTKSQEPRDLNEDIQSQNESMKNGRPDEIKLPECNRPGEDNDIPDGTLDGIHEAEVKPHETQAENGAENLADQERRPRKTLTQRVLDVNIKPLIRTIHDMLPGNLWGGA